jgi:HK97 family phage major capsid protein
VSEQNEIKALGDKLRTDWEEMKRQMEHRDKDAAEVKTAVDRVNAAISETETKITATVKDLELKVARIEQLERVEKETKADPEVAEVKRFVKWATTGDLDGRDAKEYKALATDKDPEGGYGVPAPVMGAMIRKLIEHSPVRELCSVETISSGNAWEAVAEGSTNFAAGKVGERDARTETTAGTLRKERIPVHEFYANVFVTQTMLDDESFGAESWISERIGTRRAVLEGGYHVNGTAEGEPEGLLTNADITSVNSGDSNEVTDTGLIDLVFNLPERYARNASFLWKRATTAKIRKFKDVTSGQYLWQPGLNGSTSNTVLGYRYTEAIDMPAEDTNLYPVLFGDFRAAYKIVDRKGLTLTRDPYTSKPFVEFYFTWRTGGQVVLAEAMRKLKCAS